jgi:hypothetical protein
LCHPVKVFFRIGGPPRGEFSLMIGEGRQQASK